MHFVFVSTTAATPVRAASKGFGVVFQDVDEEGLTQIEFFKGRTSQGVFSPPVGGHGVQSFLGVVLDTPQVSRAVITLGDAHVFNLFGEPGDATSPSGLEAEGDELVTTDDFLYGEPVCTRTLGAVASPTIVAANGDVVCLKGTTVNGCVLGHPGSVVIILNAFVAGNVTTTGADGLWVCGSTVRGSVTAQNPTGFVRIGDFANEDGVGCDPNNIRGNVSVLNGQGGFQVSGNQVGATSPSPTTAWATSAPRRRRPCPPPATTATRSRATPSAASSRACATSPASPTTATPTSSRARSTASSSWLTRPMRTSRTLLAAALARRGPVCRSGAVTKPTFTVLTEQVFWRTGTTMNGSILVSAGGGLIVHSGRVTGNITAVGASYLELCDSTVRGAVTNQRPDGFIHIGDAGNGQLECAGNTVANSVSVLSGEGGYIVGGNTVGGDVTVNDNVGLSVPPVPYEIGGNTIGGSLTCLRNEPLPTDSGYPNIVTGTINCDLGGQNS